VRGRLSGELIVQAPTAQVAPAPAVNSIERLTDRDVAGIAPRLSSREIAILRLLMSGASNKVIARQLAITEATVKVHNKAILRKIRVQNRTQAAVWAHNHLDQAHSGTSGPIAL
jgi:two-component system nitrate/nitrite response regulator NarL